MALFDDPAPDEGPDAAARDADELRRLVGDDLAAFARRAGEVPAAVAHSHLVGIGLA
nr:hypothetical protein [Acidimicrobiia bacterium]